MADYTKTTWQTGDIIDATKINNLETQYDTAKAAQRGGEWTMQADLDMNTHGVNGVTDINNGAVSLADGNIEIADSKVFKIGGLTVLSDPISSTGKFAKDDGTWAEPTATAAQVISPDYIFYKDGSTYYAKNARTGAVDYSGTTCSTVLQSTINNIISTWGHGAVYFRPGDTFTFTAGVSHSTGNIFLYSNGAHLDISGYNGIIFDFGSDSVFRRVGDNTNPAYLTGISGFTVEGLNAMTNMNEKLIIIRNMCNTAVVENIKFAYVYNLVEIRGGSYSSIIRGVVGAYCPGVGFKYTYTSTGGTANSSVIADCQISNGTGATYATAIGIDNGGGEGDYADGLQIHNNWIENHNICVRTGAASGFIENNIFSATEGTNPKAIQLISTAQGITITGNVIDAATSTAYGIYSQMNVDYSSKVDIVGNDFGASLGTCIYNAETGGTYGHFNIVGNTAQLASSGAGVFFSGDLINSNISGNRTSGGNSTSSTIINLGANSHSSTIASNTIRGYSNTTSTLISGVGDYITIASNTFVRASIGVVVTNLTNSLVADNVASQHTANIVTTPISGTPGSGTIVKDIKGDSVWGSGRCDEFKYIFFKSGSTYYAYDTVNQTMTSNSAFATLFNGLITTTGLTFKLMPGTYSVGATIAALGTGYAGGRIVGASEASTILQASTGLTDGIIRIGGDNWEISNVTFDGNNQSGCVGLRMGDKPGEGLYTALRCSVKDSTFKNFSAGTFPTCLKLDGNTYYENFENLRMMDNNLYGIHFNDDTGGLGDNGQTLFSNCEIAANYYCVWRTAAAATRHRIEFDRCGFYCGSTSSTYAVDFMGINNLHVNQCDFEATNVPTTAFVGVGGQNQVFTACSLYADGIPLFKSHWGGTNSGLVFTGLQCGGSSTTSIFDIDYAFTVIEPNVATDFTGKWFANITTKRRCTIVGGQTQRLPFNNAWAQLKDDFHGASLNGDIWVTTDSGAGASVAMVSDATGGVVRIATGATINTTGVLNNGTMDNIGFANYPAMEAVVKLDATPSNVVHFIGFYTDSTHYLGFRIDTAVSTNWYGVCCNGGSETATSLGVAGDTTLRYLKFYMEPSTDTAFFFIDDQYRATLAATNMPVSGVCSIRASCKCLTAADKHLDIDLIDVRYRRQT